MEEDENEDKHEERKRGEEEKYDVSERRKLLSEGQHFWAIRKRRDDGAGWEENDR